MKKKHRITAGAIVFRKDEDTNTYKFLVVQRAKDDHFPLHWEFPRGACEKSEVVVNCMMREVKEESGLDVKPVKFLGKTEYYSEKHKNTTDCYIFLCMSKSENIKINSNGVHEHEDGKWLIPEVVREMVLPDQRIFIDRALEYLKPDQEYQITDPSKKPQVVKELDVNVMTYDIYCEALDLVFANQLSENFFVALKIRQNRLSGEWKMVFNNLKLGMAKIAQDYKLGSQELISAFKNKSIYGILKAFKFNISLMFKAVSEASKAVKGTLSAVFKELYKTKAIQKLRSGAIKIDSLLNRYPKLKKIGGLAVAGILVYMWLNMTFIGDLDYDFNFSHVVDALGGRYSIADLFTSSDGLMLIALFGSGTAFGLSMPWLGAKSYNLLLALVYTGYYRYIRPNDRKKSDALKKLKQQIGMGKI